MGKISESNVVTISTLVGAVCAVVGILIGAYFSWQSQTSSPFVFNTFYYTNRAYPQNLPCDLKENAELLSFEFAPVFDIGNSGAKPTTLTSIKWVTKSKLEDREIILSSHFQYISGLHDFNEWLTTPADALDLTAPQAGKYQQLSSFLKPIIISNWNQAITGPQSLDTFEFSGTPLKIESGDVKRLILRGFPSLRLAHAAKYDAIKPKLMTAIEESQTKIDFVFDDQITKPVTINVPFRVAGGCSPTIP